MMKNTEEEDAIISKKKQQLTHAPNAENSVVLDQPRGVALSEATVACKLRKRKKSRKKKKLESGVQNVACKSQRDCLVQEEAAEPTEAGTVQVCDNQPVWSGVALSEAMEEYSEGEKSQKNMRKRKRRKKLESSVQKVACKSQRAFLVQEEGVDETIKGTEKMQPPEAGTVQAVLFQEEAVETIKGTEKMEHTEAGTVKAVLFQEEAVETIKGTQKMEPTEVGTVQMSDNVVLRKLLRGLRYYDPPADCGWETCYNCGEEGHATVNCAAAKELKKPCYLCGSLMHQAKRCKKERDCIICRKVGHPVKNCRRTHVGDSICLRCGISGHDMFSCGNFYSLYDLKEIQCYVCKSFGHLCCANTTGSTPIEISCYKCGQTGHTGLACSGEGLFYRECWSNGQVQYVKVKKKVRKREHTLSKTESPTFQKENDYMGDRSAPHDMGMPYMEKKPLTEERAITTQQPSKHRGGCRVEHLDEMSPSESKRNSWMSPITPSTN